jgi:hypothetical protein
MPKRPPKKSAERPAGKPAGRPPGVITRKMVRRTSDLLAEAREIRKTPKFRAWHRMTRLAEEIDVDLQRAVEKAGDIVTPADESRIWELRSRLAEALKILIPYEKPRLTAVKVSGDRKAPLFDLSGLTGAELEMLRGVILKSQQLEEEDAS